MKYKSLFSHTLVFFFGVAISYGVYRIIRHNERLQTEAKFGLPPTTTVRLDSTNLPILLVSTDSRRIYRDSFITARMTIIYNGVGRYNYSDTITHPGQDIDYNGFIALRYRGNTSFAGSLKKPYALRTIDKPLEMGGGKIKTELLGMRKGKKWALLAPYSDRSMIRDALTYELARKYMDFVPQTRFCELVLNGVYMGIHILTEQITADRLKIGKPNKKGNDITGGYLFEIDRRSKDTLENNWPKGLIIHSPNKKELTNKEKEYIVSMWNRVDSVLTNGNREQRLELVDEQSFIDFQLVEEVAFDTDGYNNSTYLYKSCDPKDCRLKMAVWDFNVTYGNNNVNGWMTDDWQYKRVSPRWWVHMMEDPEYRRKLISRWQQFREEEYSNDNIERVIDSMVSVLVSGGAEARNAKAWKIWHCADGDGPTYTWPNKYVSSSYEDEIDYLKNWIWKRLDWMDKELK